MSPEGSNRKIELGKYMRGSLFLIMTLIIGSANATRITVGPDDADYDQIQEAVDNASIGDIIEVRSGTYLEHVSIAKALTLISLDTGKGLPIINASGSGSALTLMANGSIVEGFNLTGSGHCGCGNAGILVKSGNNTVYNNIAFKNKYGIFVKKGYYNNSFFFNDLLENEIAAHDKSNNSWSGRKMAEGIQPFAEFMVGKQVKGNHYSDYDEPEEGCKDSNDDGICDKPRKIKGGSSVDEYPLIAQE